MTEIREYGATSIQVTRRLRALIEELRELVVPENRPAVDDQLRRLDATVSEWDRHLVDLDLARIADPQGLRGPAWRPGADQSDGAGRV